MSVRCFITLALSYFLSLCLFLLITGAVLLGTVFNPEYAVRQINRSGFIEQARAELGDVFISHGFASGMPRSVMETLVTGEDVGHAVRESVRKAFGAGQGYPFTRYEEEFFLAFRKYSLTQGVENTDSLRDLASLCADAFEGHTNSFVFSLIPEALRFRPPLFIVTLAALAAALALAALIPAANRTGGCLHALAAVSLICAALPALFFAAGISKRLHITPLSYNMLISSWLDGIAAAYMLALIPLTLALGICAAVRSQSLAKGETAYNSRI
jgi:hypothetical protein